MLPSQHEENPLKTSDIIIAVSRCIASSATGDVHWQPPVSGNVQPPVSHSQHSSPAKVYAVHSACASASPKPPVPMPPVQPCPQAFLVARKNRSTGENLTDQQQFFMDLIPTLRQANQPRNRQWVQTLIQES